MDKKTFASSAIWKISEAVSTKGIALIISIVLARILLPEDYGIVTLTAVTINLSTILVQSGLVTSLVRKEKISDVDYNNGFFIGFVIALVCYMAFFIISPALATFYNEPLLSSVLRIQMLSLFLVAFGNIQTAIIMREFRFRELCLANVVANIISGVTGLILAYVGFGVWSLVIYTLLRDVISNFIVFMQIKWRPSFVLDFHKMKLLFGFSIWVLLAALIDFVGNNYSSVLMGKVYSISELGLYSKGYQIPEMICLYSFGAIGSVLLPTLSNYQSDKEKLKHVCKRLVAMSSYTIFPMMVGLGMISKSLIPFLYTDKWNGSIPIFIFACILFGVNPLRSINIQLIYAIGNSKKALLIETIRSSLLFIGVTVCAFVVKSTIYGIAFVAAMVALVNVFITQFFVRKYIQYGFKEWIKDILPAFLMCIGMALGVFSLGLLPINSYLLMFIQIIVGALIYIVLSTMTNNESYNALKTLLFEKIGSLKKNRSVEEVS